MSTPHEWCDPFEKEEAPEEEHQPITHIAEWLRRQAEDLKALIVGSSRVDLQACKLEYSIVSPK